MNRRMLLSLAAGLPFGFGRVNAGARQSTPVSSQEWAHPDWFSDAEWIEDHNADDSVRIVALTPASEFAGVHIPNSTQIDWTDLALTDSADATIDTWQTVVCQLLADRDIQPSTNVAIYDGGTFYAARLWWILDLLGHADKRVLDGGLQAWTSTHAAIETGAVSIGRTREPYPAGRNESALARIDDVADAVAAGSAILIDARTPEEFAAGHIPGAINIPFTENAVPNSGGKWKSPTELRAMYEAKDVTDAQPIIPYCSTGVRSAVTWFTLKALGYDDVKLYSASYAEWSSDPTRSIETGP